jgi:hypothetical protein
MARINLYIRDVDEPLITRFREALEKRNVSMSEFLVDAAKHYLDTSSDPEEIVLEGLAGKRVFKGNCLYWHEDRDVETGVYLTAKGAIAYWHCCPRAINAHEREVFEVYDDLDELFQEQDWLEERRQRATKQEIQQTYADITGRRVVEHLDI